MEELFERKRNLEERIENYFGDWPKFTGDRGYQDLLVELSEVEEQINQMNSEENGIS